MHYLCVKFGCHGEIASFKDPEHFQVGGQHFRFELVYAFFTANQRKMPRQTPGNALSVSCQTVYAVSFSFAFDELALVCALGSTSQEAKIWYHLMRHLQLTTKPT